MDLQSICREVMETLDDSLGCVLTDLETGLPLAAEHRTGTVMNADTIALVSYVGINLFHGKLVHNFERSLAREHGSPNQFVREVQLTTSTTYQFMSTVPGWDQAIFILVTNRNVSLGMGLLAVHDAVRRFEAVSNHSPSPAFNPAFRPAEEPSEPSLPQPSAPRRPERDTAFDAPRRREVVRERQPQVPQRERNAAPLVRASSTPEANIPEASPRESIVPSAEMPTPSPRELPEAAPQTAEAPHPEAPHPEGQRYYRGALMEDSNTEESTPVAVPTGPRARMFFKRPRNEKENSRRRRS